MYVSPSLLDGGLFRCEIWLPHGEVLSIFSDYSLCDFFHQSVVTFDFSQPLFVDAIMSNVVVIPNITDDLDFRFEKLPVDSKSAIPSAVVVVDARISADSSGGFPHIKEAFR